MAFEGLDLACFGLVWFVECTDTPFGAHFLITLHIVAYVWCLFDQEHSNYKLFTGESDITQFFLII